MEWLSENWFWLVVGILFVVLHLFGHGGHGGHGAGARRRGSGDGADRNDHGKHAQ